MHPITLQCTFKITLWKMLAMMMIRRKEGNHFPSFILKSPLLIFSNVILKYKVLQYEITVEWSTRNSQFFEGTKTSHVLSRILNLKLCLRVQKLTLNANVQKNIIINERNVLLN